MRSHEGFEQLKPPDCSLASNDKEPCINTLELPEQLQGDIVNVEKLRREILSQLLSKVQSNTASLVEQLLDTGAPLIDLKIRSLVGVVWQSMYMVSNDSTASVHGPVLSLTHGNACAVQAYYRYRRLSLTRQQN